MIEQGRQLEDECKRSWVSSVRALTGTPFFCKVPFREEWQQHDFQSLTWSSRVFGVALKGVVVGVLRHCEHKNKAKRHKGMARILSSRGSAVLGDAVSVPGFWLHVEVSVNLRLELLTCLCVPDLH
jgi:hypothetical protein